MKTQKHITKTKVFGTLVGVILAFGNMACDQNKGSSPAPAPAPTCVAYGMPGYTPNCTVNQASLPGGTVQLMSVISSTPNNDGQMSLQIGGSAANPPQSGYGYNGPVVIAGQMQLQQNTSFCGAWPGTYQVSSVNAGQMNGSTISGLRLQAMGPSGILILMDVSYAYTTIPGRLIMGMNVTVNGQPCRWLLTQ